MSNHSSELPKIQSGHSAFQKRFSVVIRLVIAVFLIIFSIFPVLWIISAALDPANSLATQKIIPANASFDNFRTLFRTDELASIYWRWWFNSLKMASITTVLTLSLTTLAAYAFSRLRFAGRVTMLKAILLDPGLPQPAGPGRHLRGDLPDRPDHPRPGA